ncbi:MAG TPA: DUF1343 domain-containing protein [Bellilinea sp.]|nr:DUF1343 domain-containing protein [Bellilinea sp.]
MRVKTGLEVFLRADAVRQLGRIGLVSQNAAQLTDGTHCVDALRAAGAQVTALFGPEHGLHGVEMDGEKVGHSTEAKTGIPIFSLYGDIRQPTAEMLKSVDTLIFDMQGVGTRFYTYLSTLYFVLKAAAENDRPLIVLDRPNPLSALHPAGPMLRPEFVSFVGVVPMPLMHGLTIGEFASWVNSSQRIDANLSVIGMENWHRSMTFEQTGLPWIPTSPAMRTVDTVRVYPGTCQFEGTNLSEGRGTAHPFSVIGAPWINGEALAEVLNGFELPGVHFEPAAFTPAISKHQGVRCYGVRICVTERQLFDPIRTGLHILTESRKQSPENFVFLPSSWEGKARHYDLIMGSAETREAILEDSPVDEIIRTWDEDLKSYQKQIKPFYLYD